MYSSEKLYIFNTLLHFGFIFDIASCILKLCLKCIILKHIAFNSSRYGGKLYLMYELLQADMFYVPLFPNESTHFDGSNG
jgi:hypothetical protein